MAQNKISFTIEGEGRIIGVGNGDPSCHEPDTYVPSSTVRTVALNEWRWEQLSVAPDRRSLPEYTNDFDDSSWSTIRGRAGGNLTIRTDNTTAIYRAHLTLKGHEGRRCADSFQWL